MRTFVTLTVFGENVDQIKGLAVEQAAGFLRIHEDEVVVTDLKAYPHITTSDGNVTRWRAEVSMRTEGEEDEDDAD